MTSQPALSPASGIDGRGRGGGGHLFCNHTATCQMRNEDSSPMLTTSGPAGLGSIVLSRRGTRPARLSVTAGEGQGLSPMTSGPAFPPASGIDGGAMW